MVCMPRLIFITLLVFSLCNCKEKDKKRPSFKAENFTEHYIEYAKWTLLLPLNYDRITHENLPYIVAKKDSMSLLNGLLKFLEADRKDYALFSNQENSNDVILILKSEYINFSKSDANQYLGLLEQNMSATYGKGSYERLEKKLTQTERSKYVKIKYRIRGQQGYFHQTHYVVTSAATTFGLIELRTEATDYEDLIKRINYLVN